MPTLSELAKMGVRYQQLEEAPAEQQEQGEGGNFTRGFKKAMLQLPQTAGGAVALAGDLTGSTAVRDYGLGVYQNNSDKIAAISKDSDSLSNVLDGNASGADWLANTAGYVGGQALQAIATGGVGGFIGSQLAKRGIAGVVARGAESMAAKQVAQKVASRGAAIGAGTAMLGSNFVQEAGSIYPEALHVAAEEGRDLTGADKARVVGSAAAAAGVDTAMDALMIGRVLKGARKPGEGMLRAGVREVPGAMAREGITEGIQTGIERYGAGQELGTADAIRDYVDSIGVGVVGGGMGGAASVLRANKVPESGPLTRAANTSIEQQILQLTNDPQPLIGFPDGTVGTKAEAEIWLNQFAEGEERDGKRRELMGRDPATGKRVKEKPAPEPTHAQSDEDEAAHLAGWTAQHDPVDLDYAQSLLATPGAKGKGLMIAPHPDGGFTLVEANKLTIDTQARLAELQTAKAEKPAEGAAAEPEGPSEDRAQEWQTNPYAGYKFAEADRARAFMAEKGADPEQFDVQPVGNQFAIRHKGIITAPSGNPFKTEFAAKRRLTEGGYGATHDLSPVDGGFILQPKAGPSNADNAVLAQDSGTVGGRSDKAADPDGSGEAWGTGAAPGFGGERAAAVDGPGQAVQPAEVRDAGSADADAALIEQAANEAATSPLNDLPEPTQAQKEAGNYKVGRVKVHGLDISIENPAGSKRKGVSPDGKAWENELAHHYGYIKRTQGADGDHVDAFIGPNPASDRVFVVDQIDPETGDFDEHKVLFGFDSEEDARAGYEANYQNGWQGGKAISETSAEGFKTWLNEGDTKSPYAPQAERSTADVPERPQVPEETPTAPGAQGAPQAVAEPAAVAKTAGAAEAIGQVAPRAGDDIPLAFYARVKVPAEVFNEETGATEAGQVQADVALRAVREDIANLQALIKCMKGGA